MTQLRVDEVYTIEVGGYSSWEKAHKVVRAFNQLSGMQVKLEDIQFLTQQIGRGDVERRHTPTPH